MERLAHCLDVGWSHAACDGIMSVIDTCCFRRLFDFIARRLADILAIGAVVDDQRDARFLERRDILRRDLAIDQGLLVKLPVHRSSPSPGPARRAATRRGVPAL